MQTVITENQQRLYRKNKVQKGFMACFQALIPALSKIQTSISSSSPSTSQSCLRNISKAPKTAASTPRQAVLSALELGSVPFAAPRRGVTDTPMLSPPTAQRFARNVSEFPQRQLHFVRLHEEIAHPLPLPGLGKAQLKASEI